MTQPRLTPLQLPPEPSPGTLPDGRAAIFFGDPERWGQSQQAGPASSACLALLMGGPVAVGALTVAGVRDAIRSLGVECRVEYADSLEDLAQVVELGRSVIAVINAGTAWDHFPSAGFGEPDHPVLVPCVARDPQSGAFLGAFVLDPTQPGTRFVEAGQLVRAWLEPGGLMISADQN